MNNIPLPVNATSKKIEKPIAIDQDGSDTLNFLTRTKKIVDRITGSTSASLGLHPAIYFYGRSGNFQAVTFLAVVEFVGDLIDRRKLRSFTSVRSDFEKFIFENKEYVTLTVSRLGSGARSLYRVKELYNCIMNELLDGKNFTSIKFGLFQDPKFAHLGVLKIPPPRAELSKTSKRTMSRSTKSAIFFRDAIESAAKCQICGSAVHSKSMTFDHILPRRDGGTGDMANGQIAHPYCNSDRDNLTVNSRVVAASE